MQGRNGPWSHMRFPNGSDYSNAIDFTLPLGTEVLAVRGGRVRGLIVSSDVYYEGDDPEGGLGLPPGSTNMIVIGHDDGTTAVYMHLAKDGVTVRQGDIVKKGIAIARTGLSGWVGSEPHLHFQVNRDRVPLPVQFEGYRGPLEHYELYPSTGIERK